MIRPNTARSLNILAGIWSVTLGISGMSLATSFVLDLGDGALWCPVLFGLTFLCAVAGGWETRRLQKRLS